MLSPRYGTPRSAFRHVAFAALLLLSATCTACDGSSAASDPDASADAGAPGVLLVDSGSTARDATASVDAGGLGPDGAVPKDECEAEAALASVCGHELQCGATKFLGWCGKLRTSTTSAQRAEAIVQCSTADRCDADDLATCIYQSYGSKKLSDTQFRLVRHYCDTCYAGDLTGAASCFVESTRFTRLSAVTDIFLAAWELGETLTAAIDAECLPAPDAGVPMDAGIVTDAGHTDAGAEGGADASDAGTSDAGTSDASSDAGIDAVAACARAFAQCAGGYYVDSLPECP